MLMDSTRVPTRDTPMWLSHHVEEQHDRCVRVNGFLICRRCLVLYPLSAVIAVTWIRIGGSHPLDRLMCWGLVLPALIEFTAEQAGWTRHRPARLVAVTAVASLAIGRGVSRYLQRPGDVVFWVMVAEIVVVSCVGMTLGVRRRRAACDAGAAG